MESEQSTSPAQPPFPLPRLDSADALLSPRRLDQWTLAFLLLGLLARCVRYFLRFPLWEDECFMCANFLDRDYRGLLEPLHYHQVSPILFLWLQLTVIKLFGYTEMTLRLVPFLAGLGSMVLFYRLAKICLTGVPRLLAVALFSVTYAMIRYSAEAKPYGIELFVSLVLVNFLVNWLQRPESNRWLWVLAAAIPLAVGLSYGAVMLGGGLSLTMAWVIWRQRRWSSVAPWLTYSVVLLGSFLALYLLCIKPQATVELDKMQEFWGEQFPPINQGMGAFAQWIVYVHCADIMSYPAGGAQYQSTFSAICWLVALVTLLRRRSGTILVLALAPQAVTFVAAAMKRYPYGGHIRLNLYLAPFMCMLIGYGAATLLAWAGQRRWKAAWSLNGFLGVLVLVAVACIGRDLAAPYKNVSDQRARGFAQWFWFNQSYEAEVACVTTDLGVILSDRQNWELNYSAQYRCNQRIYSPRHAARQPIHWDKISSTHPLRCVLFRPSCLTFDEPKYRAWMAEMRTKYDLVHQETLRMTRLCKMGWVADADLIDVYSFVPKPGISPTAPFVVTQVSGAKP